MIDPRDAACIVLSLCAAASFVAAAWFRKGLKQEILAEHISHEFTKDKLNITLEAVIEERKRGNRFEKQLKAYELRIEALESRGA